MMALGGNDELETNFNALLYLNLLEIIRIEVDSDHFQF